MPFQIVGIGEILWDVFPDQDRFGGAPCNFACSASELAGSEAAVDFVGAVGEDTYGKRGVDSLGSRGVNTKSVQSHKTPTGRVTVKLDDSGAASYVFDSESAWDFLTWNLGLEQLASKCDAVCFGTLGQRGTVTKETIRHFVKLVPHTSLKVLDINLRAPYFDERLILESIALANVLKLNETELPIVANACHCSGSEKSILLQLTEKFKLNTIALTKGESGAVLVSRGTWCQLPSRVVEVADTVGAGDAYTAAMVLGLLYGNDVESINRKAIEVASFVCTQSGATMPFPFRFNDLR
ncbi:MAG: PfkB family carbohydrate kinase [Pirellula sp.]|jgi:fructokinase|nr:PfkB family carbohydrate kinase [Pirellula sp.]